VGDEEDITVFLPHGIHRHCMGASHYKLGFDSASGYLSIYSLTIGGQFQNITAFHFLG
jgi:hypothetical protein